MKKTVKGWVVIGKRSIFRNPRKMCPFFLRKRAGQLWLPIGEERLDYRTVPATLIVEIEEKKHD